ncbi:RICIN domain-containing protein [Kitasatospora sp. NPDC051853]|uniref:RICIN domain-containing protein n=1 Tax=Kitasatospora sp. NPDC051853 TaxID=3364058 RepID=UPI0037A5DBDE
MTVLPQNGQVYVLKSASGTVADVSSSSTAPCTRIQAWQPNGTKAQTWVFWAKENGTWLLETGLTKGTHAPGQAMVMDHNFNAFNTHLYQEHGQDNQRWYVEDAGDGWVRLRTARGDGGYLTADQVGSALGVWALDQGGSGQRWQLVPVGGAGSPGGSGGGQSQQPQQPSGGGGGGGDEGRVIALVNAYRARRGLGPVQHDGRLTPAAVASSQEQARRGQQGHWVDLGGAFTRAGYRWGGLGEVAGGAPGQWTTPESMVQGWIDHPPHEEILRGDFRNAGASRTVGGNGISYWSMVFARPL